MWSQPKPFQAHMQIYIDIYIYTLYIERQTYIYLFFLLRAYEFQKVLTLRVQARAQTGVSRLSVRTQACTAGCSCWGTRAVVLGSP